MQGDRDPHVQRIDFSWRRYGHRPLPSGHSKGSDVVCSHGGIVATCHKDRYAQGMPRVPESLSRQPLRLREAKRDVQHRLGGNVPVVELGDQSFV